MKRFVVLALATCALCPVCASAETWSVYQDDQRGGLALSAMPDESESDTDIWLVCRKDGRFNIGLGANTSIGQGHGEAVSAVLSNADKSVTIKGASRESINAEMTGGTELTATIAKDDPLFAVLSTGKPMTLKFGKDATRIAVTGLKKNLATFLARCEKK